ncbi:MAG: phosphoenolpyruvate synthase, partial [Bacteroidaceae bacterium]|nr:phosphoenolpyruvate synthase [Bacteroidaceae bacterium]
VDNRMQLDEDLVSVPDSSCLLRSHNAIGHGVMNDISDIVYVKTGKDSGYTPGCNPHIAEEVERINRSLLQEERKCLLIGPGRWGSSDPWLGIPVKWPHISSAQVIVETGLENYQVDPSQGTHFFQNLTSLGVGYLTINAFRGDGKYDSKLLDGLNVVQETEHVRHVRLTEPLVIKIDGMKKEAVVMMPESLCENTPEESDVMKAE